MQADFTMAFLGVVVLLMLMYGVLVRNDLAQMGASQGFGCQRPRCPPASPGRRSRCGSPSFTCPTT